jgi:hypothetical protein
MDSSISTIFTTIIVTAVAISSAVVESVRNISSWKRKYVGFIKLDNFHFKDEVQEIYEKKTGTTFTPDMCTTLVVYIKNEKIQFFNPKDNLRVFEFKFSGLNYDQDTFNISEDGLTFFSRDQDYIIVSTMRDENKTGILPVNSKYATGYFHTIRYSLDGCRNSMQIATSDYSKFCFNKSSEQFALAYNGYYKGHEDELTKLTKNGKTQLSIHNTFTGSVKRLIEIDVIGVKQMNFSDNGLYIALVLESNAENFMIYNTITGHLVKSLFVEELKMVSEYQSKISWSPDSNKITVTTSRFQQEDIVYTNIVCFTDILTETPIVQKIVIDNATNCVESVNWNETNDMICFYYGNSICTFNFETKILNKKTIADNLTNYIIEVDFVTSDLLLVVRGVEEKGTFKDKTYKSSYLPDCPPDKEVPYVDIIKVQE